MRTSFIKFYNHQSMFAINFAPWKWSSCQSFPSLRNAKTYWQILQLPSLGWPDRSLFWHQLPCDHFINVITMCLLARHNDNEVTWITFGLITWLPKYHCGCCFQHVLIVFRRLRNLFFSCDQAALQMVFSVCPSVCLSVRLSVTPFSPCSHHRIIMKFSGVITMVKSDVHAKGQGQRSKVKVTEVNTQLSRFRTLTPVWIHIWQNHMHSWKQHRRGALLFFKVIRQISRSHGSKNRRIWPRLGVSGL